MPKIENWIDINKILGGNKNDKDSATIAAYANLFGVPFYGINLLQEKPYINSLGLHWKWKQHPEALTTKKSIRLSKYTEIGNNQVALVKVSGDGGRGHLSATGSASKNNLRGMMKDYPNEMAETRAWNRLLRKALAPYIYEDFLKNLQDMGNLGIKLIKEGKIQDITGVSYEELNEASAENGHKPPIITLEEKEGISDYLKKFNEAESLTDVEKIIKLIRNNKELTEPQLQFLKIIKLKTIERLD